MACSLAPGRAARRNARHAGVRPQPLKPHSATVSNLLPGNFTLTEAAGGAWEPARPKREPPATGACSSGCIHTLLPFNHARASLKGPPSQNTQGRVPCINCAHNPEDSELSREHRCSVLFRATFVLE
ncbi:hypothetical protein NDU88_004008 [Pleurodeles waltl]|uniref:Uncharacterized protein n=1 Tax=Pleurodeles waltl TaxID=8319 RepID=A0AAV7WUL4_PLEWA|nr:hypothetical protein NDU88_004008 [Pleurodeles waltl]